MPRVCALLRFPGNWVALFNVFGPRQDPDGAYSAVIPKWTAAMIEGADITINGDGLTTRDFCYVANIVQSNFHAALADEIAQNQIYNVALGERTSLDKLFAQIRDGLEKRQIRYGRDPIYVDFRTGDMRHSQADISKARKNLGYSPTHGTSAGIEEALSWYFDFIRNEIR